jgi:hypothetical protein
VVGLGLAAAVALAVLAAGLLARRALLQKHAGNR